MDTIGKLKELGATIYLSTAGGGAAAITDLCSPPGRSSVILGATFINDTNLFNKYIGVETWSKYASQESARALSIVSQEAGKNGLKHIGIGIASSLATNNERVGRVNLTNIVATGFNFEVSFTQEFGRVEGQMPERERYNQEDQIRIYLNKLIDICYEILKGNNDILMVYLKGGDGYKVKYLNQSKIAEDTITIYPGSFNPIHDAHRDLKVLSETLTSAKTVFEISLVNFEKKRIDFDELNKRIQLIGDDVIVSYDKTFVEKYNSLVKNYPHLKQINFVCGIDTWDRISDSDKLFFYSTKDVKFIVFARSGEWINRDEITYMNEMLFVDNRLKHYNNPMSSSQIRKEKSEKF